MTTKPGPGRRLPEPAVCPNGHVNRPGTRICAVCRALIPPPAPAPVAPAAAPPPAPALPAATPRPSRAAHWALGLVLLLLALAVAVFAVFYPIRRRAAFLATAAVVTLPAGAANTSNPPTAPPAPPTATPPPGPTAALVAPGDAAAGTPTPVATITPLSTIVGVVLTPTLATAPTAPLGPNLIQNGDFRADWVNGWERTAEGVTGVQTVETRLLPGEPPLASLVMSKSGAGRVALSQSITLAQPPDGLVFRAQLRLAGGVDGANEGRSALLLRYEDGAGQLLGVSMWLDGSATTSALWGSALPPFGPGIAPRIQAAEWQTIEIALAHEFTDRLPDVDAAAVRRITIVLLLAGTDGCPPDACVAELSAAALSLVPGELAP